ncbi:hypothetical protein V6N11_051770 [Hibiscus sabdariffa]|uniref:Uncharacterized protein n=1 Tax=Hibiscus sabdariffa TaxID=183260 RepID=A0ABR2U849_9ROSI
MFSISNIEMSSVILEITKVEEQVPGEGAKVDTDPARQRERWCLLLRLLENKLPGRVREPAPASEQEGNEVQFMRPRSPASIFWACRDQGSNSLNLRSFVDLPTRVLSEPDERMRDLILRGRWSSNEWARRKASPAARLTGRALVILTVLSAGASVSPFW